MGLQYSKVFQRCTNHLYKLAPIFARNVQIREVATIKLYQEQKYASYCIWCNRKSKNRKSISKHEQMVAHWRGIKINVKSKENNTLHDKFFFH